MTKYNIITNLNKIANKGLNKLEPLEKVIGKYLIDFKKNLIPENSKYKYLIAAIHIIHFIGVFCLVTFGLFMPPKLQIYIFFIYLFIILSWIFFDRCILIILTNYIGNTDHDFLFPFRYKTFYFGTFYLMTISLTFYFFPKLSFFNILKLLDRIF